MKKIMIIEDEKTICNELSQLLENNNYETIVLKNFEDALNEILYSSPDLILLDINIPYINGEILLKNLRKTSSIPVVMVTSRNSEIDEVLSMSYGADEKDIKKALFKQTLIFFIMPLSLAIVHTIFGLKFCTFILSSMGIESILDGSLITFIFLIGIYGLYFLITYYCNKNIIKERN